jgi:Ras-related protein Rab-22
MYTAMYYRGAAAAIIVYDISRGSTFKTLKTWVEELKNQGPKDIAIAIAGNKADLEDSREVDRTMAAAYAEEIGAFYLETSAKDDLNVQDIFVQISNRLPAPLQVDASIIRESSRLRSQQQQAEQAKKGCC